MIETATVVEKANVDVHANGTVTLCTLDVRNLQAVTLDCILSGLTGGTSPTVQFTVDRKAADDSTWVNLSTPTALSADGVETFVIGPGLTINVELCKTIRVQAITTGGPSAAVAAVYGFGDRYSG